MKPTLINFCLKQKNEQDNHLKQVDTDSQLKWLFL